MNYMIEICRETISLTGYKTIQRIVMLPRHKALKILENETIIRRFNSPFNSSIEVVVIQ